MMDIRKLTDDLSVTGQISAVDVAALKQAGFATIMCNRPDDETADQTPFDEIADAARSWDMSVASVPVSNGAFGPEEARRFAEALEKLPKPAIAYCRSGMRSTTLWAMSQAGEKPTEDIFKVAQNAGYDLTPMAPLLAAAAQG